MNSGDSGKAVRFAEMAGYVREGVHALQRRTPRDAVGAFERAYQLAMDAELGTDALIGTLRNLALARREAGDLRGAVAAYRTALRVPEMTGQQRAAVLHGLGVIYLRRCAYRRAEAVLTQAHALWQQALDPNAPSAERAAIRTEQVRVALDLSRTLRSLGRHEQAHGLLQAILQDLGPIDPSRVPYCHLEMARIALGRGFPKAARHHLKQALTFTTSKDPGLEAEARLVEAELLSWSGRHRSALVACARAVDLGVRHYLWEELRDAHGFLRSAGLSSPAGPSV